MEVVNFIRQNDLYNEYPVKQRQDILVSEEPQENLNTIPSKAEDEFSLSEHDALAPKHADLENISLTFLAEDDFAYIGCNSALESLDVMQAVSEMQKDSVLHQYHTFFEIDEPIFRSEDGLVFIK